MKFTCYNVLHYLPAVGNPWREYFTCAIFSGRRICATFTLSVFVWFYTTLYNFPLKISSAWDFSHSMTISLPWNFFYYENNGKVKRIFLQEIEHVDNFFCWNIGENNFTLENTRLSRTFISLENYSSKVWISLTRNYKIEIDWKKLNGISLSKTMIVA